jgi:Putative metal-binding motif
MRTIPFLCFIVACASNVLPEAALIGVEPQVLDVNQGGSITLVGAGLLPAVTFDFDVPSRSPTSRMVSAFLTSGDTTLALTNVTWVDERHVTGTVAADAGVGLYDVHVVEARGRELVLSRALQLLDCLDVACPNPDGGASDAGSMECTTPHFSDRDRDGFGSGTAQLVCGAGWVAAGNDCDDRDVLTHPGAVEVCNGLDDDCDGTVDDGACADAGWSTLEPLRLGAADLLAGSSYASGSLWIAAGSKLFVRRGDTQLADVSAACPPSLRALWAEPTGEVEVAGAVAVANQTARSSSCASNRTTATLVSMVGFMVNGTAQYFGIQSNGQLYTWAKGGQPQAIGPPLEDNDTVFDLHGSSPETLLAVGVTQNGQSRHGSAWAFGGNRWVAERLGDLGDRRGALLGVWVLSPTDAVAVGERGIILRRTGVGWRTIEPDSSADLTSVRAFSAGRFYVSRSDGRVSRYANGAFKVVFQTALPVRLNDLTGTAENDLWVLGNGGLIARGPR